MPSFFSRYFGAAKKTKNALLTEAAYPASFMHQVGQPVWMRRDYGRFAEEAYARNVVAHRAVDMIAQSVASVPLCAMERQGDGTMLRCNNHAALSLLSKPNPHYGGTAFVQALISYQLIAGNAFVLAVSPENMPPLELHLLRPDRVAVIAGEGGMPAGYRYKVGENSRDYAVDRVSGQSRILHLKQFHPLDDWYGLSAVEAAAYAIDQHNQAGAWNQALLQHGARPSGALVVNVREGTGHLSEEQYYRIKQQMDEQFSGASNAGRPLLLEGGLDWKEMSLSPKDMDFIEAKHSSARDIALAFGVPPQLLGIPGDNTYSNLAEARLALWEQTVLPMVDALVDSLNHWLMPMFDGSTKLEAELDALPALTPRRDALWQRAKDADFLSEDEKRAMVGV